MNEIKLPPNLPRNATIQIEGMREYLQSLYRRLTALELVLTDINKRLENLEKEKEPK